MDKKYDAILVFDEPINEASRIKPGMADGSMHGPGGVVDIDDPKLRANDSLGRYIQQSLTSMGYGFWGEVSDFGKWVVVTVGHHNYITGKTATKTFLIVFNHDKRYTSVVMTSSTKWRTITSYDQAVSYIKSCANLLSNETNRRM